MGLKRNFAYSIILTTANYLFPLIVFPYVSRCLGVYNIGICNFTDNVIQYFTMLSMMGMGVLGIREIAAVQNDPKSLNKVFSNLFYLNLTFTVISIATLIICINTIPQFCEYRELMYIGCFNIAANFLLLDWMYKGLEKFPYITKRTLIVKCLYVAAVFLFIHEPKDYILYYILTTLSVAINAAINLWHSRHFIKPVFSDISLSMYFKPFIKIGTYWVMTTLYASFYTLYLGFVSTPEYIGYFTTASKLIILTMSVYTAWTNVVLPRSSALLADGQNSAFNEIVEKSTRILFTIAIPIAIMGCFFSQDIIAVLAGAGYEGAYVSTAILMPLIFIIGYSQILIIQILMPMKKETVLFRNAVVGAVVGVSLGLLLVPRYLSVGASISWLTSEIVVLILSMAYVNRHIRICIPYMLLGKHILCHIPTAFLCLFISETFSGNIFERVLIGLGVVIIYTTFIQITYLREPFVLSFVETVKNSLKSHRRKDCL